jgi:hypothetical protein
MQMLLTEADKAEPGTVLCPSPRCYKHLFKDPHHVLADKTLAHARQAGRGRGTRSGRHFIDPYYPRRFGFGWPSMREPAHGAEGQRLPRSEPPEELRFWRLPIQ